MPPGYSHTMRIRPCGLTLKVRFGPFTNFVVGSQIVEENSAGVKTFRARA